MLKKPNLITLILCFCIWNANAQDTFSVEGNVTDEQGTPIPNVNISVMGTKTGTQTDFDGNFSLKMKSEEQTLRFSALGFRSTQKTVNPVDYRHKTLEIKLMEDAFGLDQVVVTGTRDRVETKKLPVVVNAIKPKLLEAINSSTMSESLNFTPGVRLETNCQNCNTTQVRMNGLDGAYSQILINGRPIYSALNGVYGLEQIPSNMIDRIEVVRGGGSALYGAGAVGGTINVITKEPVLNSWSVDMSMGLLGGKQPDRKITFNTNIVSDNLNSGISLYGIYRNRDGYDYDGDGFTEKTELKDNVLGLDAFLDTGDNGKLKFNFMGINSFRRGGDHLKRPPHETAVTEQLDHNTVMGGLSYDFSSANQQTDYSIYTSGQYTYRKDYYGGLGGDADFWNADTQDQADALAAYGTAPNLNLVNGLKAKHIFNENNKLTLGVEQSYEDVDYQVPGYNKITQQYVRNYAGYAQYEWNPFEKFTALIGARVDHANINGFYKIQNDERAADVSVTAVSPRLSLMYDWFENMKIRGGYARGFRPPRAYDEDFEVGSADEKQTFIMISPELKPEYSDAFTLSFNYDNIFNKTQTNFLIEGFYTRIERPFTGVETGESDGGFLIEEIRNGKADAYVAGLNFDFGVSPSSHYTFQIGGTIQTSKYKAFQELNDPDDTGVPVVGSKNMMRTPDFYGYLSIFTEPIEDLKADVTGTYTGPMDVPHLLNEGEDFMQIKHTRDFFDIGIKLSYQFKINDNFKLTPYAGMHNVLDAYQQDWDQGPDRDSDYIYGPANPRTYYFGVKMGSL